MNAFLDLASRSRWQLLLIASMALFFVACGDEGIGTGDEGDLEIQPPTVDFGNVVIGETTVQTVDLINDGETSIQLYDLELGEAPDRDVNHEVFEILNPWGEDGLELEGNERYTLEVEYTPQAPEAYGAEITFGTSIADLTTTSIDVVATTPAPELLTDETVVFDRTPLDSTEWRLTEIENIGTADLKIDDIVLGGRDENNFDLTFPVADSEAPSRAAGVEQDSDSPPETLSPGESAWLRIAFTAPDESFKSTEIVITSNVPQRRIAVGANSDAPCLELVNESVDFGLAAIDDTTQQTVTLRNCSRLSETVITGISIGELDESANFEERDDTRFSITTASLPGEMASGGTTILGPNETTSFLMTYSPIAEQIDEATLRVQSEAPTIYADITGEGADLECPVAEARAQVAGSGAWSDDYVFATPLDVIEFDGSNSFDPDGTDVNYEWTLIDHPMNSTTQLQNPESENPELFLDIAGPFVVELTVYDGAGIASCDPAVISVEVVPEAAIHVELTWEVPSAPDGTGTDLDLHYLHPNGSWSEAPYGVYWLNRDPDWEDGSEISLDIDDLTGAEPENINHDNPDPNYDYSTGVYYFGDPGFGATDARVRIFFHDSVVFDREQRLHNAGPGDGGDFWYVADIGVIPPGVPDVNELQIYDEVQEDSGFPSD